MVTYEEWDLALHFSKAASSPGLDGLRYMEDIRHEERATFNVVSMLCKVFNNVQRYGVVPA